MKHRLQVADLNAIESRVGGWLASCPAMMGIFVPCFGPDGKWARNGKDPYIAFAAQIYARSYDSIYLDTKSKDKVIQVAAKLLRQIAKPGFLGAIYRMGGGKWAVNKDGDRFRTGLWGYAWGMGAKISQEQAVMIVRMFRESYSEIVAFWKLLEDNVLDVMDLDHPNTVRRVGPNGCVVIDKFYLPNRDSHIMRMRLPSGRHLHYMDANIQLLKMPWEDDEGKAVYRDGLVYAGVDQKTKRWGVTTTHGGKLFENLVQGIARDVLAVKLLEFEANDMPIVAHVHDEGVALVPDDEFSPSVDRMIDIMSTPISWAEGLLLGADGFQTSYYRK